MSSELIAELRAIAAENEMILTLPWPLLKQRLTRAADELSRRPQGVGDREQIARGAKLVPVEPTEEMILAGARNMYDGPQDGEEPPLVYPHAIYRAMLAAAPPCFASLSPVDEPSTANPDAGRA